MAGSPGGSTCRQAGLTPASALYADVWPLGSAVVHPADPCCVKHPSARTRRSTTHWSQQHPGATSQQRGSGTDRKETGDLEEQREE